MAVGNFFKADKSSDDRSHTNDTPIFAGILLTALAPIGKALPIEPDPLIISTPIVAGYNQSTQSHWQKVRNAEAIVNSWSPDQSTQVYVSGDVGLGERTLTDLAIWIEKNAPHSLVYLAEDMSREQHNGRRGFDAVDYRLNLDLFRKSGFSALKNPRTDEADGVLLIINFAEGDFSIRTSEAHENAYTDKRLVDDNLQPKVQDFLRKARQDGGAWDRAVRDTFSHIQTELDHSIEQKEQAKAHQEAEKARIEGEAKSAVRDAKASMDLLTEKLEQFRREHPNVSGDIAYPDTKLQSGQLAEADASLNSNQFSNAAKSADLARQVLHTFLTTLDQYSSDGDKIAKLSEKLGSLSKTDFLKAAQSDFDISQQLAARAASSYANGSSKYRAELSESEAAIERTRSALSAIAAEYRTAPERFADIDNAIRKLRSSSDADKAAQHIDKAEQLRESAERLRLAKDPAFREELKRAEAAVESADDIISSAATGHRVQNLIGGVLAALAGSGLGIFALRVRSRRKEAEVLLAHKKEETETKLAEWNTELTAMSEALIVGLETKVRKIVGNSEKEADQSYNGETERLALAALKDLGGAYEKLNRVGEVLKLVEAKIAGPTPPTIETYREALKMLSEPVVLGGEQVIPVVIGEEEYIRKILSYRERKPEERRTLDQVMQEFRAEVKRINDNVTTIDTAQNELMVIVEERKELLTKLGGYSGEGIFSLPAIQSEVLPFLNAEQDRLSSDRFEDPVGGRAIAQKSSPLIERTSTYLDSVSELQAGLLRSLPATISELNSNGVKTEWIQTAIVKSSKQMNTSLEELVARGSTDLDPVAALRQLEENISIARRMAQEVSAELRPDIESVRLEVQNARRALADRTGIPEATLFQEEELTPAKMIVKAEACAAAIVTALSKGDLAEAIKQTELANAQNGATREIINDTVTAATSFVEESAALEAAITEAKSQKLSYQEVLLKLTRTYAPTSLLLATSEKQGTEGDETVANNITESEEATTAAERALSTGKQIFKNGRIIESLFELKRGHAFIEIVDHRYNEISSRKLAIELAVRNNSAALGQLEREKSEIILLAKPDGKLDSSLSQRTIETLQEIDNLFNQGRSAHTAEASDPIANQKNIDAVFRQFKDLQQAIELDVRNFREAERSLKTAEQALIVCRATASDAAQDPLPDSKLIGDARESFTELDRELKQLKQILHTPHQDWVGLDRRADLLSERAAQINRAIKKDIEQGELASAALRELKKARQELNDWNSNYGVKADRDAGFADYNEAARLFALGSFTQTFFESIRRANEKVATEHTRVKKIEKSKKEAAASSSSSSYGGGGTHRPTPSSIPSWSPSSHRSNGGGFGGFSSGSSRGSFGGFGGGSGSARGKF